MLQPQDTPAVQAAKKAMQKAAIAYTISHPERRIAEQKKLRAQYEPVETIAAQAIEELHKSMYGESGLAQAHEITKLVSSYLTPEYVQLPRKKYPTIPIAHPVEVIEKNKKAKEKQD